MSVSRQANILGQMRVDVPHLRAIESSICADFDLLAGAVMGGGQSLIVKGFSIATAGAVGLAASSLQVVVAGSIIFNTNLSESGTIYQASATRAPEQLSSSNSKVIGSFVAGASNFVGIDVRRSADSTTADPVS